jgi:rSAM/selenodomain-associated transferase 1
VSDRPTLIVMVKTPRAGRVKTRLGREISMVGAAWWYRHQITALTRRLRDPRWRLVLAATPDRDRHPWPRGLPVIEQGRGDIGRRMARCLASVPRAPVCLIGSDIPGVTPAHIAGAFRALGRSEVALGPARDGGFWLIGLRRGALARPGMFGDTRWSHPCTLADTCRALSPARIALTDMLTDVDCAADLRATTSHP